MARPYLGKNPIVRAIKKALHLKKGFIIRALIKKYCNLENIN